MILPNLPRQAQIDRDLGQKTTFKHAGGRIFRGFCDTDT